MSEGKLNLGRTRFVSMPSWHLKRTALLTWKGAGAIQRMLDLFLVRFGAPILSRSHQKVRLVRLAGEEKREHIRASIPNMDPSASWLRRPNGTYLAHPDIGFTLLPFEPLVALFPFGGSNAYKGFLRYASKHFFGRGTYCKQRLHEETTPTFIANLPRPTDLVAMRQIDHFLNVGKNQGLSRGGDVN